MSIEYALQKFPKETPLKDGTKSRFRVLRKDDEKLLHSFFLQVPDQERMFIKHRVTEESVIREWCQNIDIQRNLPLLGMLENKIAGVATLPKYRGRGLARALVTEMLHIARQAGLEHVEAEFIGEQEAAIKMFALMGFSNMLRFEDYVKDMQAVTHDYILMGLKLKTEEEYAGVG
jgi:ribosomal protein S18 acetylase RimI-like enzyme